MENEKDYSWLPKDREGLLEAYSELEEQLNNAIYMIHTNEIDKSKIVLGANRLIKIMGSIIILLIVIILIMIFN